VTQFEAESANAGKSDSWRRLRQSPRRRPRNCSRSRRTDTGSRRSSCASVAKAESGFRADAVSPKGAVGIMQLMPATARKLGADPTDPRQNVEAGTRYLSELLLKYKDDPYQVRKALAAYNAGPGAVER